MKFTTVEKRKGGRGDQKMPISRKRRANTQAAISTCSLMLTICRTDVLGSPGECPQFHRLGTGGGGVLCIG